MEEPMTPSAESKTTTEGQIAKAVANYRALLEKHAGEFDSQAVQTVLGQSELADEQFAVLRHRIEMNSEMIVRHVKVNRSRKPQQVLDATGRKQYVNSEVVAQMPGQGEGEEEVNVYFFPLREMTSVADAQKALEDHGLKPDAYAVAVVNEADPSFADSYPNGTQWVDSKGKHCCTAFDRWGGGRRVVCYCSGDGWSDDWWLGGVHK
jgi:hypothetical protein